MSEWKKYGISQKVDLNFRRRWWQYWKPKAWVEPVELKLTFWAKTGTPITAHFNGIQVEVPEIENDR